MQIDFNQAYEYCKQVTLEHYENFPVGSLLIPKQKRKYIYSIYAFARYADDIADSEKLTGDVKLQKLENFSRELLKAKNKEFGSFEVDTRNIFTALSNTIDDLKISVTEFEKLLFAFGQDSVKQTYETFDELITYSTYSANPVGHLVLNVFGYKDDMYADTFALSDKICTALQLTNFWQDVSRDLNLQRVYIPAETMRQNYYTTEMLYNKIENEDFRRIMRILVSKTRIIFEEGGEIINHLRGRVKLEIKATIAGGLKILNKIERINYNVLTNRVEIRKTDLIKIAGSVIWR